VGQIKIGKMVKMKSKNRKNALRSAIAGTICAICLLATAQGLTAQTIQFQGVSCVFDTIVEVGGGFTNKFVRVGFKYTLDENVMVNVLTTLLDKGQFRANRRKYKANSIVFDIEQGEINTKKNGIVSLVVSIPVETKIESLRFVFNKQEIPLRRNH
jgi:signal transduction histidine kinase